MSKNDITFRIFLYVIGICGLLMLIAGWIAAMNYEKCADRVEKSGRKASEASIMVGTFLFTMSFCYLIFSYIYGKESKKIEKYIEKANYLSNEVIAVFAFILGIIGVSLGGVISNAAGEDDPESEYYDKQPCQKIKNAAKLMIAPSIIVIIISVIYFFAKLIEHNKKGGGATKKKGFNVKSLMLGGK